MPLAERERGPDASDGLAELLPYLRAIVSAFRIPAQDADDLLQDALVIYLVKRVDVRAPRSWLGAVTRHRCRQYWDAVKRRHGRAVEAEALEEVSVRAGSTPENRIDCQTAVRLLPARGRSVITLRYRSGMSRAEIAERTGLAEASIDKTARRALSVLRRRLGS